MPMPMDYWSASKDFEQFLKSAITPLNLRYVNGPIDLRINMN